MIAFFIQVGIALLVLGLLVQFRQTYPNRRLVIMALVPGILLSVVLVVGVISQNLTGSKLPIPEWFGISLELWIAIVIDIVVITVAAIDYFSLPRKSNLSVTRQVGRVLSLRQTHPVELVLVNHSRTPLELQVRDGVPNDLECMPADFTTNLPARSRVHLEYRLRSKRRGAFTLKSVFLQVGSRWRLWKRFFELPAESVLHVYPDMKQLAEYALLARTNRLNLLGVRRTRRIGQDNEFERLRDYTPDDNYKFIDWRSTARRRKLTVKDFQQNQSQRVIFLIDCGRMMTNQSSDLSLLDHSLNAMLMLSYVALSYGDSVGLLCFSDEIHGFVPPGAGLHHMNQLLHASFDRFPRLVESRYDLAFLYLAAHCRKRSMVVLITNIIDEVNSHQTQSYLTNLVGRHLPLGVLLRDRQIFDVASNEHPRGEGLYRTAAACQILNWRQQVLNDLTRKGVLCVDVFPEDLTAPLINSYLDVKARHLL